MPEVMLQLRWPDGEASQFYSPSTVIYEFLKPGETLTIAKLEQKGLSALQEASERVHARYGCACTRTDKEATKLQKRVAMYGRTKRVERRNIPDLIHPLNHQHIHHDCQASLPSLHFGNSHPESKDGGKRME